MVLQNKVSDVYAKQHVETQLKLRVVYVWTTIDVQYPQWTDCIIDTIFKNIKKVKIITTALKSILNLVKLQSLVAKCCKM